MRLHLRGVTVVLGAACLLAAPSPARLSRPSRLQPGSYRQTNLVSDIAGVALNKDTNLINPWGIAIGPTGVIWVANAETGTSTLYDGEGNQVPAGSPLVVSIPAVPGAPAGSTGPATGTIFNGTADFVVSAGGRSGPARFLFAEEDGGISGWSPAVNPTSAVLAVDNSAEESIYKGLAMGQMTGGNYLYATDFHGGKVDVYDAHFQPVDLPGGFTDPNLPADYAPFGISNIGGNLLVTYAQQDEEGEDDVPGPGFGYVDLFDTGGHLLRRFASGGALNAPWGLALAPRSFGRFGGALLVGNFGDGRINAYNPVSGSFLGPLTDFRNRPIAIDGLWGLMFGVSGNEAHRSLYFTAGIADETHGLFGVIQPGSGRS